MKFEDLKRVLTDAAKRAGIKDYEIYYQCEESLSAETLKDEISAFSSSVSGGVCFRCIADGKMGYASGERLTADEVAELVDRAVANAKCIDCEDEPILFAGSAHYEKTTVKAPEMPDAKTIRENALELQRALYRENEKVTDGTQTGAMSATERIYLYNSHGLELSNEVGMTGIYANAVVRDGEEAQEAFEFVSGVERDAWKDLPARTVTRALEKIGARLVESGTYPVVFTGKQFRAFLSTFSPVFSAKNAQQGLSLLAGKEGTTVASSIVTLTDDPMRAGCPMQAPFDGEGVATSKKAVIESGVLKTLLYDLTTAKKAGTESTGNGQKGSYASPVSIAPYSFGIAPGTQTRDDLLAAIGDGILVTECKGFHAGANAVTGDFSIESAGFRVRNGKRAEPIKSFTVSGNFFELLKQIDALGDTVDWDIPSSFTIFGSPDVMIREMKVAGK